MGDFLLLVFLCKYWSFGLLTILGNKLIFIDKHYTISVNMPNDFIIQLVKVVLVDHLHLGSFSFLILTFLNFL